MGPFLGQGGSAALEDAVVPARCLGRQYCLEMKREWIEAALDQYIREGEKAKVAAFVYKTFTIGSLMESSVLVKILCVVVLIIFFRDRLGHTRYDCGPLYIESSMLVIIGLRPSNDKMHVFLFLIR